MVTPTFPRQLLEVDFHFTENFIFQNKAKGEANILLVNLHGPHWAISSHEKDWTQHPNQMWTGQNPKHSILQIADKILQSAHVLQTGKEMATE